MVSDDLKLEARKAFVAYEDVFIKRIVKKLNWHLAGDHLEQVLATGDEARVRSYIDDLHAARRDIETAVVV